MYLVSFTYLLGVMVDPRIKYWMLVVFQRTQRWEVVKSRASPKKTLKKGDILHLLLFSFRPHLFLIQRGGAYNTSCIFIFSFSYGATPTSTTSSRKGERMGGGGGGGGVC